MLVKVSKVTADSSDAKKLTDGDTLPTFLWVVAYIFVGKPKNTEGNLVHICGFGVQVCESLSVND